MTAEESGKSTDSFPDGLWYKSSLPHSFLFTTLSKGIVLRTICIRTKVDPECLDEIREWFNTLKERLSETMETLESEGVVVESAFLDRHDNDVYLIYYLKAEDIDRAYEVFDQSTSPIDIYFKGCWKKYCSGRVVLEELLDLERL